MNNKHTWLTRYCIVTVVAGCAGALTTPAFAGETQPEDQAREAEERSANDIVVTAQRREELLEDVPMAVQVVTAEAVENAGVNNFMELSRVAPGVLLNFSGSVPGLAVRGIGSAISGYNVEPNVAIYIDGFYDPQPVTIAADMANLESIQILKGPQGTLYGRNATGGALLINTLGPTDTYTGKFDVSYGRLSQITFNGYVAGPLSDHVRVSLSGHYRYGDQAAKLANPNVIGGTIGRAGNFEYNNLRAKLELDLGENLVATLGYNYSKVDDYRANYFSTYDHIPATLAPPPLRPIKFGVVAYDRPNRQIAKTNEGTLKLELTTGIGTLTSYTGYAHRRFGNNVDFDGTYRAGTDLIIDYKQDTFQQSVDYTIDAIDNLALNIGGLYYKDKLRQPGDINFKTFVNGALFTTASFSSYSTAWALYADGTYKLADKFSINLGARYSYDKKRATFVQTSGIPSFAIPFTEDSQSWKEFTPRATLRYEIAPRTNVYASVSRGYRAGAYSAQGPAVGTYVPAKPEKITAYEVGFKTGGSWLRFQTAAFYYDYTNLQVTVTVPLPNGTGVSSVLKNAPKAKVKGFEAEISANPVDNLTLRGGVSVLDAKYGSFTDALGTGVNAANTLNVGNQPQDWTGKELVRAPNYSGNVGFDYELPTSAGTFLLTSTLTFTDSFVVSNPSLYGPLAPVELRIKQRLRQKAYQTLSAQLSWTDPSDHLTLALYGNNLTNTTYRISYNAGTNGDYSARGEPITYGVRLGYRY